MSALFKDFVEVYDKTVEESHLSEMTVDTVSILTEKKLAIVV